VFRKRKDSNAQRPSPLIGCLCWAN